jgi:hypothetical protein
LAELEAHDIFRGCDHRGFVETILGHMLANGKPLDWHLNAIRRVADKAGGAKLAGQPWPDAQLGSYLLTLTRSPDKPREGDKAPPRQRTWDEVCDEALGPGHVS